MDLRQAVEANDSNNRNDVIVIGSNDSMIVGETVNRFNSNQDSAANETMDLRRGHQRQVNRGIACDKIVRRDSMIVMAR